MEILALSRTKQWLQQFDDGVDRESAKYLAQHLRCISPNLFNTEVRGLFNAAASSLPRPIAIYTAREIPMGVAYFSNKKNRPIVVEQATEVGSEGTTAYLATTLAREQPELFLNHPPIMTLERKKCRSIVICDDVCGSGKRVSKFLQSFLLTPTIKSWLSLHLIQFHIVAYAISTKAEDRIRAAVGGRTPNQYIQFHFSQRLVTGPEAWSGPDLKMMTALCKTYGERHKVRPYYRLGYDNCMSTLVFHHSCPNTTPGIVWQKTKTWTPLFPERTIPVEFLPVFTDEPSAAQQTAILQQLDAEIVSRSRLFVEGTQREREFLLLLAAVRSKAHSSEIISTRTGMSVPKVKELLQDCYRFGLLDSVNRLTKGGWDGLKLAEERAIVRQHHRATNLLYFPTSLRPRGGQER